MRAASRSSANPSSAGVSRSAALSRSAEVRRSGASRPMGTPSRVMTMVSPRSTWSRMLAKFRAACVAVTAITYTYYQTQSDYAYNIAACTRRAIRGAPIDYLRTRKRRTVTAPCRVLRAVPGLSSPDPGRGRTGCRRRGAPAGHRPGVRPRVPAAGTGGYVGTEDFEVLAARGLQCGSDRFPDVTGEVGDIRGGRVRRPMGEDERGSGEGVAFVARRCPPLLLASIRSPTSSVRRPTSMAPVAAAISASQAESGAMKSKIQSIASPGPAMKPSSDIDLFTTTLPLISRPPSRRTRLPRPRPFLCFLRFVPQA